MLNNRKIESNGVNHLASFINKNHYLQTYLDQNDKTPSWDGVIHVLKNPTDKKEDILGIVPVQVKATQRKSTPIKNFRLNLNDLELYLRTGGVMLFVVSLDDDYGLKGIYYKSLPPLTIKNLIKNSNSKKSKSKNTNIKSILVNVHALHAEKVYSEMVDFIKTSDRQRSFVNSKLIDLNDFNSDTILKFYHYCKNPVDIFNYQEEHDIFPYMVDLETGTNIPVDGTIKVIEIFEETDFSFSIGESFIFNNIKRHRFPNGMVELHIDECFTFVVDKQTKKYTLNFSRSNKLSKAIKCTEALLQLLEIGHVKLNDCLIEFNKKELAKIKLLNLDKQVEELRHILNFFNKMGIDKDIDLSLFDNQSQKNFYFLNKGLILKEKLFLNYDESKLLHLKIANIHIITLYSLEDSEGGYLVDIFSETPWCKRDDKKDTYISIFEVLEPNDWLKIDNCKFDSVISSFQKLDDNNLNYESADNTIIKILAAADMTEEVSKKEQLLNWAQDLSDWNLSHFINNEISIINDLQIKIRTRKLNDDELEMLNKILNENYTQKEICFAVWVLLGLKSQADILWNKFNKETQNEYMEYPIYNLYKNLEIK